MVIAGIFLAQFGPLLLRFFLRLEIEHCVSMGAILGSMEASERWDRRMLWFGLGGYGISLVSLLYSFFPLGTVVRFKKGRVKPEVLEYRVKDLIRLWPDHRTKYWDLFSISLGIFPMQFTAVFMPVPEGYIGFIEELPGANTQGETLEETRENLKDAVPMVLDANREIAAAAMVGKEFSREPFDLTSQ